MSFEGDRRVGRFREVAGVLGALADDELAGLLVRADPLGAGIGGRTAVLRVGDVPVFVKRIPLTDLEARPENAGNTANLFGLPTFYQYGVGSAGFGVWRELAAHVTTTGWVLDGHTAGFPLMYQWRVLPAEPRHLPVGAIDAQVAYWDSSAAVRDRLEALAAAASSVVVFLEHVPRNLHEWMSERFDHGDGPAALAFAERELSGLLATLRERGIVHFDAHPGNVLSDGRRLYLGDLGLLLDETFALSPLEADFLRLHRDWDRYDVARYLVNWVCRRLAPDADRQDVIRRPGDLPGYAAEFVGRYGATALVLNDFYDALVRGPKTVSYPAAALAATAGTTSVSSPARRP